MRSTHALDRSRRNALRTLGGFALALPSFVHAQRPGDADARVLVYTSLPVADMRAVADGFRVRHGIDVDVWRAGSEKVVARMLTEASASRFDVDIVETNGTDLEALARRGLLHAVRSERHADLVTGTVPENAAWAGTRLGIFVQAYNTSRVRRDELPRRWDDLADARWIGRLAIEAEDADWFSGLAGAIGEAKVLALFSEIVKRNGVSVRRGHSLIAQMVAAGEIDFALTVYNYKAQQLKEKGAPIDWYAIPPAAIAKTNGIAVATRAPHPRHARLFYDYVLSREGQAILLARDHVPTHRELAAPLTRMPMRLLDAAAVLDDAALWRERFAQIFLRTSR